MKYNPALDGIRALAVLAVVCHHAFVPGFENGRAGVDVFFVLSGYLITSLLVAEERGGGIRLGAFYLRRARRLYPALLLMVGLTALGAALIGHPLAWQDAAVALTYLSDYGAAYFTHPAEAIKHTWSLSVEEHFYLLWPFVVMGFCRLPKRTALWVLVLAYVLATGWRLHVTGAEGDWIAYYRFDTRLSGLLLGSLLAFLPVKRGWGWAVLPLAVLTAISTDLMSFTIIRGEWLGAALVMWARSGAPLLTWKPLPYIGRISYGVYLFHWPLALLARTQSWPVALSVTLLAVPVAALSYATVERLFRSEARRRFQRGIADAVA